MMIDNMTSFEIYDCIDKMDVKQISVICNTYNHKSYINYALDSFVKQITNVPFEIIVFDDASTDGTSDVVREYAQLYPKLIRAYIAKTNTYLHPLKNTARREWQKENVRGRYIAFCEGDDFWIDNRKLQKQYDALEEHDLCDMCACWGCTTSENGEIEISQIRPSIGNRTLSPEEVILGGGQYLVSSGLFFRKEIWEKRMRFQKVFDIDYSTQIRGSLKGGIYYIDDKMAAYRRNAKGSWSERVLKDKTNLKKQWTKEIEMLKVLDEETSGIYHEIIIRRLRAYTTFIDQLIENKDAVFYAISLFKDGLYLWGMGRRGESFEEFCYKEGIALEGCCDLTNEHVGEQTLYGNRVFHTNSVLKKAKCILASNKYAYEDLVDSGYSGEVINLQNYMPYG